MEFILCFVQMMGLIVVISLEGGDRNGGICLFFFFFSFSYLYLAVLPSEHSIDVSSSSPISVHM